MSNHKNSFLLRWLGRTAVLAGSTFVLSWSAAPAAFADDGGLLGGVPQAVGEVTEPVVQPTVEAVQSALPQPVQEAVEPVVEPVVQDVVNPVVSQADPTVEAVTGASDQAADPVEETAEPAGSGPEEPGAHPVEDSTSPQVDPVRGPAHVAVAPPAPAPTGPANGDVAPGTAHAGAGPTDGAIKGPRDGESPSEAGPCPSVSDLPPRGMAVSETLRPSSPAAGQSAHHALWDLTYSLMNLWADGDTLPSDERAPDDGASDRRPLDLPVVEATGIPVVGTSIGAGERVVLGLIGLLVILAAGAVVVGAWQLE